MSFAAKMRRTLRAAFTGGACSVVDAAGIYDLSRRTLSRRLRAEGTTFEALLEEVRYEVACQRLGHTDLLVRNVATFTRAFRRWFGTTPARWRAASATARQRPGRAQTDVSRHAAETPVRTGS